MSTTMNDVQELGEQANQSIIAQFVSESGENTGGQLSIPLNSTHSQLELLVNHLLSNVSIRNLKFLFPGRKTTILFFHR